MKEMINEELEAVAGGSAKYTRFSVGQKVRWTRNNRIGEITSYRGCDGCWEYFVYFEDTDEKLTIMEEYLRAA